MISMATSELRGRRYPTDELLRATWRAGIVTDVVVEGVGGDDDPWLLPGLVDLQVNGYGGFDVNGPDVTPDSVTAMAAALAAAGTTSFVPTVITASDEAIEHSLRVIARACEADPELAASVPWLHVEGPHISPEEGARGAHALDQIRPPNIEAFDAWQEAASGRIGMVTICPHHEGSVGYIAALTRRGVRVSIGHTSATEAEITAAVGAGARFSTHLGNGIQAMIPRHANPIWPQVADQRLTAGLVVDGHHLPLAVLASLVRGKGVDHAFAVSDSVALAGRPPGLYEAPVGGMVELSAEGRLRVAGTSYLAGAVCALVVGLSVLDRAGIGRADALRLVCTNPGRLAGDRGELEPGRRADLVLLSPEREVVEVVRGGHRLSSPATVLRS